MRSSWHSNAFYTQYVSFITNRYSYSALKIFMICFDWRKKLKILSIEPLNFDISMFLYSIFVFFYYSLLFYSFHFCCYFSLQCFEFNSTTCPSYQNKNKVIHGYSLQTKSFHGFNFYDAKNAIELMKQRNKKIQKKRLKKKCAILTGLHTLQLPMFSSLTKSICLLFNKMVHFRIDTKFFFCDFVILLQ